MGRLGDEVVFGGPYEDTGGLPTEALERLGQRLHSVFFAVFDRPRYVPEVMYFPELRDLLGDTVKKGPSAWIRISIMESPRQQPVASATVFARPG